MRKIVILVLVAFVAYLIWTKFSIGSKLSNLV